MKHYSKQREAVLNILKTSYHHPTAEEVYQKAIELKLGMSKSTVYRNLNLLTEEGTITKLSIATGPDRYDYIEKKHNHAICNICGEVCDFKCDAITHQIAESIQQQTSMDIIFDSVIVQGVCERCKSKFLNL